MELFFKKFPELREGILLHRSGRIGEFERGKEPDPELVRLLVEAVLNHDGGLVQVGVVSFLSKISVSGGAIDMLVEFDKIGVMLLLVDLELLIALDAVEALFLELPYVFFFIVPYKILFPHIGVD